MSRSRIMHSTQISGWGTRCGGGGGGGAGEGDGRGEGEAEAGAEEDEGTTSAAEAAGAARAYGDGATSCGLRAGALVPGRGTCAWACAGPDEDAIGAGTTSDAGRAPTPAMSSLTRVPVPAVPTPAVGGASNASEPGLPGPPGTAPRPSRSPPPPKSRSRSRVGLPSGGYGPLSSGEKAGAGAKAGSWVERDIADAAAVRVEAGGGGAAEEERDEEDGVGA